MKKYLLTIVSALVANTTISLLGHNTKIKVDPSNLYVLGDSLSDTGNFAQAGSEFFKNDGFPLVQKITMAEPFYKNSFSNGPVAIQVAADKLGYSLTNAYKFIDASGTIHEKIGNNYAYAGSQASDRDDLAGTKFLNHFDLTVQTDALLSQHKLTNQDKIFLEIGTNDIIYSLTKILSSEKYQVIDKAVANEELNIEKLYNSGAKHILLTDVLNVSMIPAFNRNPLLFPLIKELVNYYNSELNNIVTKLNQKYQQTIITEVDSNMIMNQSLNVFLQDKNHNVKDNIVIIDYFRTVIDGYLKPHYNPFIDRSKLENYFWFDLLHPGAWAHNFLGQELVPLIVKA